MAGRGHEFDGFQCVTDFAVPVPGQVESCGGLHPMPVDFGSQPWWPAAISTVSCSPMSSLRCRGESETHTNCCLALDVDAPRLFPCLCCLRSFGLLRRSHVPLYFGLARRRLLRNFGLNLTFVVLADARTDSANAAEDGYNRGYLRFESAQ